MRPNTRFNKRFAAVTGGACMLLAAIALYGAHNGVHAQAESDSAIRVGTYEPQTVFSQSPMQAQLQQKGQEIRAQLQQAQQSGDRQALQKLQSDYQQAQQQIFSNFEQAIREAAPTLAEENDVQIVAVDVVYESGNVETMDLSSDLAEKLTEMAPEQPAAEQPQQQLQLPAPQ